jgi:hypothetical protein
MARPLVKKVDALLNSILVAYRHFELVFDEAQELRLYATKDEKRDARSRKKAGFKKKKKGSKSL